MDATNPNGSNGYAGQPVKIAPQILERLRSDPADDIPGMPPNYGKPVLPHVMTMQGMVSTISKAYRMDDEALRNSLENARFMELDVGLRECLEARWRSMALLNWHLEAEDTSSNEQREFCEHLTKVIKKCPRFMQVRESLAKATYYGRYGTAFTYGWERIGSSLSLCPVKWRPIHGDKLVFRLDDGEQDAEQVGIRVGYTENDKIGGYAAIETTDRGRCYFLPPNMRRLIAVHKHQIEDAAYEDIQAAGHIHGVGIRSRIYWEWVQKQETLRWLMEYLERSAFGMDLWFYPEGNDAQKEAMMQAARDRISNFRNQVFIPVPADGTSNQYGLQHVETGMAGMSALQELVEKYFGHRMKRLILGQTLTSESEGGGLGSDGIARVHLGTFKDIIRYDATNLEETLTTDLVRVLQSRYRHAQGFSVRFVIETETVDVEERLDKMQKAWQMGARLSETEVLESIDCTVPGPEDRVLQSPQQQQGADGQQQGGMGGGMGATGRPGRPTQPNGQPYDQGAMATEMRGAMIGATAGSDFGDGESPEDDQRRAELQQQYQESKAKFERERRQQAV